MALSPTAATTARDTKRNDAISALETAIDAFISQSFESNQLLYDVPTTVSAPVLDEIVNRYRNAGWLVEERVDFHNNRRLVLSAP